MKKFWTAYKPEVMVVHHNEIFAPALLIDPTGELVYLINNVFYTIGVEDYQQKSKMVEMQYKINQTRYSQV